MESSTSSAKYFFLHIGIIALLYTVVTTFITFTFDVINYLFPDRQAFAADPYSSSLRTAISVLIVAFPVLIYLSRIVHKELVAHPENRGMAIRRWLSYLTLFLSGAAIVIDLIVLINTFLGGEITSRFFYKVIIVLVVAFAVFWYTIRDLRGVYFEKPKLLRLFTLLVSFIILASIVGGFLIMGSPAKQRMLRDDMNRVGDLQTIQWNVLDHYRTTGNLPGSLEDLKDEFYAPDYFNDLYTDPETGEPYEYRPLTATTSQQLPFELCATFGLDSQDLKGRGGYGYGRGGWGMDYVEMSYPSYPGDFDNNFKHTEGRNCFTRSISKEKYPVFELETQIYR
jgi:hypothetical protein